MLHKESRYKIRSKKQSPRIRSTMKVKAHGGKKQGQTQKLMELVINTVVRKGQIAAD